MKRVFAILLVLCLTAGMGVAVAENDNPSKEKNENKRSDKGDTLYDLNISQRLEKGLAKAGATDAQIERVKGVLESNSAVQTMRREQLRALNEKIREAVEEGGGNQRGIERMIRQAGELRTEIAITSLDSRFKIRAIVGDEVWDALKSQQHRRSIFRRIFRRDR